MGNKVFWLFNKTYFGDFSLCGIFLREKLKNSLSGRIALITNS